MDDARRWSGAAGGVDAAEVAVVQPGDPWGLPLPRESGAETPAPSAEDTVPAALWRRVLAFNLDLLAVVLLRALGDALTGAIAVVASPVPTVAEAFGVSWALVVPPAYFVLGHGTGGQTPGKWLVGIRVVAAPGGELGYVHALGRLIATVLAILPVGLGLALAAVRADRRGAHDLLAGTRVVRAR